MAARQAAPAASTPGTLGPPGAADQLGPADQPGPAESRALVLIERYAVTVRGITALAAGIFCLLTPAVSSWQIPISIFVIAWSVLRLTQRRRPSTPLLLALDLAVVCFVSLTTSLTTTATAVLNQSGLGINVANPASLSFAWRARRSTAVLLCVTVIACYLFGASMVPGVGPPWTTPSFYLLPIQAAVSRALVELFIPAARAADRESAARLATAVELEVASARRTAEREHWAVLHDTAASTLLMVGEGVPAAANDRIRRQARRDLATLGQLRGDPVSEDQQPAPDGMDLAAAIRHLPQRISLRVELRVEPGAPPQLSVPNRVGRSIVGAVGEVLTNVERHSGVELATIDLRAHGEEVEIIVSDAGSGFDPALRGRGLSESVIARMQRVGGSVDINSTPGRGSVIRLRWRPS